MATTVTTFTQLQTALAAANAAAANTGAIEIDVSGTIAQTADLGSLDLASGNSLTIRGTGSAATIDGQGQYGGLQVVGINETLAISDITLANNVGENLFLDKNDNLTLSNATFSQDQSSYKSNISAGSGDIITFSLDQAQVQAVLSGADTLSIPVPHILGSQYTIAVSNTSVASGPAFFDPDFQQGPGFYSQLDVAFTNPASTASYDVADAILNLSGPNPQTPLSGGSIHLGEASALTADDAAGKVDLTQSIVLDQTGEAVLGNFTTTVNFNPESGSLLAGAGYLDLEGAITDGVDQNGNAIDKSNAFLDINSNVVLGSSKNTFSEYVQIENSSELTVRGNSSAGTTGIRFAGQPIVGSASTAALLNLGYFPIDGHYTIPIYNFGSGDSIALPTGYMYSGKPTLSVNGSQLTISGEAGTTPGSETLVTYTLDNVENTDLGGGESAYQAAPLAVMTTGGQFAEWVVYVPQVGGTFTTTSGQTTAQGVPIIDDASSPSQVVTSGGGTLVLDQANTYSGGTTISGGTLEIATAGSAGSGAITFAAPTSGPTETLTLDASAQPTNGVFQNTLTDFNATGETLDLAGFTTTATLYTPNGTSLTVSGTVGSAGRTETYMLSDGALYYAASSDGNGGTFLTPITGAAAQVVAVAAQEAAAAAQAAAAQVAAAAAAEAAAAQAAAQAAAAAAAAQVAAAAAAAEAAAAASVYAVAAGTAKTVSDIISDAVSGTPGVLTKTGAGTLTLIGTNTYTGGTFVEGGTLAVTSSASTGTGTIHLVDPALEYQSTTTYMNPIELDEASSATPNTLTVDGGGIATQAGAITTGTGTNSAGGTIASDQLVEVTGAGTLVLSNTGNIWSGGTAIDGGGTLSVDATAEIGTGGITLGGLTQDPNATQDASTTGTLVLTNQTGTSVDIDQTIDLAGNGTVDVTTAGVDDTLSDVSGSGTLIKAGAGTLTLSGTNTYTGGTTISGGTLEIETAGSAGSGAITFAAPTPGSTETLTLDASAQPINGAKFLASAQPINGATFLDTLTNFNAVGETLDLVGFTTDASSYTSNGATLTVSGTFGKKDQSETYTLSNGATYYTATSDDNDGTLLTPSTPPDPTVVAESASLTGVDDGIGKTVTFTVHTTENVTATGSTLTLNNGAVANLASGDGTSALVYSYTVAPGQDTPDLQATAINGTITDSSGFPLDTASFKILDTKAIVDTIAPVVTASSTGVTVQATSAAGATETFIGSATDAVDGTADPIVYTEQLAGNATKVVASGDTFAIGTHTITASATDAAGNFGTATAFSFNVVDTTAPVVTASPTGVTVQATSAAGATETFIGSATDAVDGTADPIVYTEQLAGNATKVVASGDTFAIGTHTITASAIDAAGNFGTATAFSFNVVDTTAPVVTASPTGVTVQATSAAGATETFIGSATDAVDGTADPIVYTEQLAGNATKVVASGDTFAIGTHTITASAIDAAGNVGTATAFSFSVVDTIAPVVKASATTATVQATSAAGATEAFTGSATDAVDGTADPIVYTEQLAGNATKVVHSGDTFALGTHTITASATDAAGNIGSAPFSFSVVDTIAPVVKASATAATVQATSAAGATETFTGSATDAVDGTSDPIVFTEQLAGNATKVVHSGDTFAIGTHTIVASATDAAGNTGSAPFSFSVVDTIAPVVKASATTATVQATSTLGAVETFIGSATDAVDGTSDPIVYTEQLANGTTATVKSGGTFAVGLHTIVASATDSAANTGRSAAFTFVVTPESIAGGGSIGSTVVQNVDPSLFGSITHDVTSPGGDIYALFETILGRAPDAIGFETLVAAREDGISLQGIAHDLLASAEYTQDHGRFLHHSNRAFVDHLYENAYHRDAGSREIRGWDHAFAQGTPRKQVAADIVRSAESHADLAPTFQAGVFVPSATDSTIARLYYGLLDRQPDIAGLSTFEAAAAKGAPLTTIASKFIHSAEYTGLHGSQSNAQFVEALFESAFGHAEGVGGAQGYLHELNTGASRATVALSLLNSPEAVGHLSPNIETGFHVA